MDVDAARAGIDRLAQRQGATLLELPDIASKLLELAALVLSTVHYRRLEFEVQPANLIEKSFVLKTSSAGRPWNYSWFYARRGELCLSLMTNINVQGAFSPYHGTYNVDVAVISDEISANDMRDSGNWWTASNAKLASFVEAKRMTAYPMLLASFTGIVHEIRPEFVGSSPPRDDSSPHFPPALVTTGPLSATSKSIIRAWAVRGYQLAVVPHLDVRLAEAAADEAVESPFW